MPEYHWRAPEQHRHIGAGREEMQDVRHLPFFILALRSSWLGQAGNQLAAGKTMRDDEGKRTVGRRMGLAQRIGFTNNDCSCQRLAGFLV